jgi:hypothetical protein
MGGRQNVMVFFDYLFNYHKYILGFNIFIFLYLGFNIVFIILWNDNILSLIFTPSDLNYKQMSFFGYIK